MSAPDPQCPLCAGDGFLLPSGARCLVCTGRARRATPRDSLPPVQTGAVYGEVGHGEHDDGGWQVLHGAADGYPRVLLWWHRGDPGAVEELALTPAAARALGRALFEAGSRDGLVLKPLEEDS